MSSSTDKSHGTAGGPPRYETRDASVRGASNFIAYLGFLLVFALLLFWGLLRYVSAHQAGPALASPFAGNRQTPPVPRLQVNPRQDWLNFRAKQLQSLESYGWENRDTQTVRIPIERAMDLLLEKGLPVAKDTPAVEAEKPAPKGNQKH
ncbi:MAG: hypothetical protein LAN18_02685 [Acidobacteriia bacterium]|nr:hypothetical protein [Terriglobia bacterium]